MGDRGRVGDMSMQTRLDLQQRFVAIQRDMMAVYEERQRYAAKMDRAISGFKAMQEKCRILDDRLSELLADLRELRMEVEREEE